MRARAILLVLLMAVLVQGCASMKTFDPSQLAMAYYTQERTYRPMHLEGIQTVTLAAAQGESITLILSSQLEPLSVYPRDPTAIQQMGEALFKVGGVIGATAVGLDLVGAVANPPAPVVVDPVIVK